MVERYRPSNLADALKKPGQRGPGRPKGIPNRLGVNLKKALEGAGEKVGFVETVYTRYRDRDDPRGRWKKGDVHPDAKVLYYRPTGKGGTEGYLMSMAVINPAPFMGLIGKLLPHHLTVDAKVENTVRSRFENVDLNAKSLAELMVMHREAIGLTQPLALPPALTDQRATDPGMIEGEVVPAIPPGVDGATSAPAQDGLASAESEPLPDQDEEAA